MFEILSSEIVSRRVFYPRSTFDKPNVTIDVGEVQIACHDIRRYPDAGTVLHFHGNGEVASDYLGSLAERFLECGLNFCFAEYRGYGASSGSPSLVDALADNVHIVDQLGVPLEKLVVYAPRDSRYCSGKRYRQLS
jgi:alpha-beta hydrolase superfamily lysophospholipase